MSRIVVESPDAQHHLGRAVQLGEKLHELGVSKNTALWELIGVLSVIRKHGLTKTEGLAFNEWVHRTLKDEDGAPMKPTLAHKLIDKRRAVERYPRLVATMLRAWRDRKNTISITAAYDAVNYMERTEPYAQVLGSRLDALGHPPSKEEKAAAEREVAEYLNGRVVELARLGSRALTGTEAWPKVGVGVPEEVYLDFSQRAVPIAVAIQGLDERPEALRPGQQIEIVTRTFLDFIEALDAAVSGDDRPLLSLVEVRRAATR